MNPHDDPEARQSDECRLGYHKPACTHVANPGDKPRNKVACSCDCHVARF